ncbi:hypothetical protein PoB_006430400 [Plakobranchus ocellatus]|uniref:FLYWCH-type domain-containing protein n=1 Tax=Plakobranchus ocellatus TaxID=259542 RepID=A0AAV4D0W6_9GAST|nr:hypothetical protein PoB_006430400 [Plakobranchus ocellatus]
MATPIKEWSKLEGKEGTRGYGTTKKLKSKCLSSLRKISMRHPYPLPFFRRLSELYCANLHQASGPNIHGRCWRQCQNQNHYLRCGEENPRIFVLESEDHNHSDDSAMIKRSRMQAQLVEQCLGDSSRLCYQIYKAEIVRIDRQAPGEGRQTRVAPFESVRSSMFWQHLCQPFRESACCPDSSRVGTNLD